MKFLTVAGPVACAALVVSLSGCSQEAKARINPADEAPPPVQIEKAPDPTLFHVEHPEQFGIAAMFR